MQLGLFVLPVALVLVASWSKRLVIDDGFIYFRVVDQVTAGNGPVFNAGERVEAYTSPGWLAALVLGKVLLGWAVRLETIAVALGLGCIAVALAAAMAASRELLLLGDGVRVTSASQSASPLEAPAPDVEAGVGAGRRDGHDGGDAGAVPLPSGPGLLVPVAIWAVVAFPPTWHWATTGLDTSLFLAWIGVSAWLVARWARGAILGPPPGRAQVVTTAVLVGSGWLVRPDAMVFTLVFLAVVMAGTIGWRRRLAVVAVGLAPSVAYQVFRMGYFGALVSNPSLAKEGLGSDWANGWTYLTGTAGRYGLWFAVAALVALTAVALRPIWSDREDRSGAVAALGLAAGLAPVAGGLLHALWVVRVGGDYLEARFVLPVLFAMSVPAALLPLRTFGVAVLGDEPAEGNPPALRGAASVAAAVLALLTIRGLATGAAFQPDQVDATPSYTFLTKAVNPTTVDDYPMLAAYGKALATREAQGQDVLVKATTGQPGREPTLPTDGGVAAFFGSIGAGSYAAPLDVTIIDERGLGDAIGSRLRAKQGLPGHEKRLPWNLAAARYAARDAELPAAGVSARQALECGQLHDLVEATTAPLSPSRFLTNLVQAPSLTSMRLPSNLDDLAAFYCR